MQLQTVIFLCFLISADVLGKNVRVVGGEDAEIENFPYLASIRLYSNNQHLCGGSIISEFHILSAAHCFYKKEELYPRIRVYIGSSSSVSTIDGSNFQIKQVFIHPEFTGHKTLTSMNQHDISVLKLAQAIVFNQFQKKISLPTQNVVGGEIGILVGWGATEYPKDDISPTLKKATMAILENNVCRNSFLFPIHDDQLCAFLKKDCGVCTGDSGGPLISNNKIVGVVSMSEPCATGVPDLYTRVYYHLNFIQDSMKI